MPLLIGNKCYLKISRHIDYTFYIHLIVYKMSVLISLGPVALCEHKLLNKHLIQKVSTIYDSIQFVTSWVSSNSNVGHYMSKGYITVDKKTLISY